MNTVQVLFLQSHSTCFGSPAPIIRIMWWPACNYNTCTRGRRASFLILLMMGAVRPKHVEWLCRNRTCTVFIKLVFYLKNKIIFVYALKTPIINRPKPNFKFWATCFGLTSLHFGNLIRNERCFAQQIIALSLSLYLSPSPSLNTLRQSLLGLISLFVQRAAPHLLR